MKWMLAVAALAVCGLATAATVEERYNQSCVFCHASGAAGAPKTGDQAAWAPRLEKGMDTLVKNTREGIGAMPPRGMCGDCSDDEYRALIEYMIK
ncbi:MAG: cytochrome c5 family protein [Alcanivorax sp.]|nr:cytochrome c5 family protein [Alcanivorax sp.]